MRRIFLASSLLLLLSTPVLAGQVYQWKDSGGQTHYGSQPPPGAPSTLINTSSGKPASQPVSAPTVTSTVTGTGDQQAIDAQVKREVATQQAELEKYCATLRVNLAQLQQNPRIRVSDGDQMRRITEEERQARISDAQNAINQDCD